MEKEQTKVIEIDGIKLEVDLRYAKKIEHFRIGDRVKVLKKEYQDEHKVYPGIIVGFDNFKKLPTIVIAYMTTGYNPELKFAYINTETKETEITTAIDDYLPVQKADVIEHMDRNIEVKQQEIDDLKRKKAYFLKYFNQYFKIN